MGTTQLGCTCTSDCQTDILWSCNAAEFCLVDESDCPGGKPDWSLSRLSHYDWCIYPRFMTYEQLSARDKQSMLLAKANDGLSGSYPSTLGVLAGIMGESVMTTFDSNSD